MAESIFRSWCNLHQMDDYCELSKYKGQTDVPSTRQFNTGATRDDDTGKLDYEGFISPLVDRRFSEYMHQCRLRNVPAGQTIRASDNWQKGIPIETYAKSLVRHVAEFRLLHDGFPAYDKEGGNALNLEDVLCAIRFNVDGYLFELLKARYGRNTSPGTLPTVQDGQSLDTKVKAVQHMQQELEAPINSHDRPGHSCSGCSGEDD